MEFYDENNTFICFFDFRIYVFNKVKPNVE